MYTLIIGNKNYSSWSLRPWIFMRYFELPFKENRIALFEETTKNLLEPYGSNYKVPILQDGDLVIWDSLAIVEYLSEQYLAGKGWPENASARGLARTVSAEMHAGFTDIRNALPMNCRKKFPGFTIEPNVQADIDRIKQLWRLCRKQYGQDGPWLFGKFSIADAMYAPIVLRFIGYDVPLEGIEADYVNEVLQLTALQEWIEAGTAETEVIKIDEV